MSTVRVRFYATVHIRLCTGEMMARSSHPNKEIERAVSDAEKEGWTWQKGGGHAWGKLLCAHHDRDGCRISVWSTPKHAEDHAKDIRRAVNRCPHKQEVCDDKV